MQYPGKDYMAERKPVKWVLRAKIISVLRREFRNSPLFRAAKKNARVEVPKYNQDGSESKKPAVMYRCAECKELYSEKKDGKSQIQVDHIEPVLDTKIGFKDWNMWIERMFLGVDVWDEKKGNIPDVSDKLQILCLKCHKEKTDRENKERRRKK